MEVPRSFNLSGRHIVFGLPTASGYVPVEWMTSLINTAGELYRHGVEWHLETVKGCSLVTTARNTIVRNFLVKHPTATDLLWIDDDVLWEPEAVLRLLAWATDYDVVAGLYPKKSDDPFFFVKLHRDELKRTRKDEFGLLEAARIPAGFKLVRRHVYERMIEAYPELTYRRVDEDGAFPCLYDTKLVNGLYMGEDFLFCDRWRDIGGEVWVDPAIKLRHVGQKEYCHDVLEFLQAKEVPE